MRYVYFILSCWTWWTALSTASFSQNSIAITREAVDPAHHELLHMEREVMLSASFDQKWHWITAKALYMVEHGNIQGAIFELQRLESMRVFSALPASYFYHQALFHYLDSDHSSARTMLGYLDLYERHDSVCPPYHLLSALVYLHQQAFGEAQTELQIHLRQYLYTDTITADSIVNALIPLKAQQKLRNPELARRLSIIPGLGQAYAGYPHKGIGSLLLVGAFGLYTGFSIATGYFVSAAFTGLPLSFAFAEGGAKHAEYLAQKHNRRLIFRISEGITDFFLLMPEHN